MHRLLLHNEELREASEARLVSPGQVGLLNGWGVFSTLRVAGGVLFELARHHRRMTRDARLLRVPFTLDAAGLEQLLQRLVTANGVQDGTLRVAVVRNLGGPWQAPAATRPFDVVAFTTDLTNWGAAAKLGVVPQARHAGNVFAGTKVLSWAFNLAWYEEAHARGLDEVVLLNERGEVSECTSANLFAAHGNEVATPPLSAGCLPGVTRELLVDGTVGVPGVRVVERTLRLADLEAADEVFITSSTRELLAVESIEGRAIRQGSGVRARLQAAFRRHLEEYVAAGRGAVPVTPGGRLGQPAAR